MYRFNRVVLWGTLCSTICLCACKDLTPADPQSILFSEFKRSEIVGIVAGFGTTFAAVPDLPIKRGYGSKDGRDHVRFSGPLGLLRSVDHFKTGDHLERDCRTGQFPERWRVLLLCSQRESDLGKRQEVAGAQTGTKLARLKMGSSRTSEKPRPKTGRSC